MPVFYYDPPDRFVAGSVGFLEAGAEAEAQAAALEMVDGTAGFSPPT